MKSSVLPGVRLRFFVWFVSFLTLFAASAASAQSVVRQINAGGAAVSPFAADSGYDTGSQFSSSASISLSGVSNPAPQAVYQSVRWATSFNYTLSGLTPGASYLLRLHFVELTFTAAGQRTFNVAVNGGSVLTNFDIVAAVGQNHALVREFNATANSSGVITVAFTHGTADNPSVAGIELYTAGTSSQGPYLGSNWSIANGTTIQAENYDTGGEGVAYHDTDTANNGGQYRSDGVDIETCSDTGGGYNVGWNYDGEWLEYTTNATAGTYNIVVRAASNNNPNTGSLRVLLDGTVLGTVSVPYTGGWQTWQDFTISNVTIGSGTGRILRLESVGGGFNINSIRFAPAGASAPPTPTGLTATAGNGSVSLSWGASSGATSYNLYRATTAGGEGSTAYVSGITSTSYSNTGLTNGTTYYYKVAAVNSAGTSAQSTEASATPSGGGGTSPDSPVVRINAGGAAVSPFAADSGYSGGNQFSSGATIAVSGVTHAAPAAVYQSVRWNPSFTYTLGGLTSGTSYVVRLHFVELSFTAAGQRTFNVAINGSSVLSNFDIFAAVGQNHALEREFNATANSSGQIVVAFTAGTADNPSIAGLEVWTQPSPPSAPSGLSATAGNASVSLSWTAGSGAASYNVYRGTSAGGESATPIATGLTGTTYIDANANNGTTYYYNVASVNSAGTSGRSNEASATPHVVAPPAPASLSASPGFGQVSLSWSASSGASTYSLYRGTSAGGEGGTAYATGLTGTTFTDTSVTAGTTYYYKVAAVNSAGTSGMSPEASAAPLSAAGRGAAMPYVRYESENGTIGGGAVLRTAPTFDYSQIASEASNQAYVALPGNGAYVEWTIPAGGGGAGVDMRFTLPDTSDGLGRTGSLDCYVNGVKVQTINLSSYWSWQYFAVGSDQPQDAPNGGIATFKFDEVHWKLATALAPGDHIRIQSSGAGGVEYGVDFLEIEQVPNAIPQPANSLSVVDYGATANDGTDDLAAFNACVSAAVSSGKTVYIPAGTFNLGNMWIVGSVANPIGGNFTITGAGMWYTNLQFTNPNSSSGGISFRMAATGKLDFSNVWMNSMLRTRYNQNAVYKAFMDNFGTNSHIHDFWEEHFECGFWVADYAHTPVQVADNLLIENGRVRNNLADGINFCQGTKNSTVQNCSVRNNGDDGLAVWPDSTNGAPMGVSNHFNHNTIENNWRAGGIAFFGGSGHEARYNLIKDCYMGSGIRMNTVFPGYHFENNTGIVFSDTTIIGCGTSQDVYNGERGAIDLEASNTSIKNVTFTNIDIIDTQRDAIQFGYNGGFTNVVFNNIHIDGTGLDAVTRSRFSSPHDGEAIYSYTSNGTATFNTLTLANIEASNPYLILTGFNLIIQ